MAMESTGNIEALTNLFTSTVMNCTGVTGGGGLIPNKAMFKSTILSFVAMFSCSLTARKLEVGYQAASRLFHGLTTVFSAVIVAILSASMLSGYYIWLSSLFGLIPVIAHAFVDARWTFDWFHNVFLILLGLLRSSTGDLIQSLRHFNHLRWAFDSFRNACLNPSQTSPELHSSRPPPMPTAPLQYSSIIRQSQAAAQKPIQSMESPSA